MINTGLINYNKPFTLANGSLTTDAALSTTLQNVKDQLGNSSPLRLATNRIALGSGTISGTSLLNFPDAGTTAADGIQFGSDVTLYRSGTNILKTNRAFEIGSPYYLATQNIQSPNYNSAIGFIGLTAINLTPNTLTGSSATSALSISQTWNTTGNPTLLFANVTNTASGIYSKLMDLQVSGITMFSIDKNGNVTGASSNITNYTTFSTTSVGYFGFGAARSRLYSPADGIILLQNAGGTDFNRLQFGGTTSSFPSLKRNGTGLDIRLADDSGFSFIQDLYRRIGNGTPEGAVTAPIGAIYHRVDGGAGTSFYVKESGTGNTGWVPK